MKKSVLLTRIMKDPEYMFRVEDIVIPLWVERKDGKRPSRLQDFRTEQLGKQSSYSRCFRADLERLGIRYIQELPFPIENKDLWEELSSETGTTKYMFREFFCFDYFFPGTNIAVEIDSEFHDEDPLYDKARDAYVWLTFGIRTLRFYKYGSEETERDLYLSILSSTLKSSGVEISFDFSKTIITNWTARNKDLVADSDKIIQRAGSLLEIGSSYKVVVTEKDIGIQNPARLKVFFKDYYGKDLYIALGVKSKGIKEVKAMLRGKKEFKWSSQVGKKVPLWMTYIYGEIPPRYKKRIEIEPETPEDKGFYRLLSKIGTV